MARHTPTDKCIRVLLFLLGLRTRRIRRALAPHGFNAEELAHGWYLLSQMSVADPDYGVASSPQVLRELDAWENRWFPIIDVVLRTNFPDVWRVIFRNLSQTEGAEVAISVSTMLQRLETMGRPLADGGLGEKGQRARERLTRRGLRPAVIAQAEQLLVQLRTVDAPAEEDEDEAPVDREKAEEELWSWYLEWSGIARSAIQDLRLLRALGFRRGGRKKRREEDDEGGAA